MYSGFFKYGSIRSIVRKPIADKESSFLLEWFDDTSSPSEYSSVPGGGGLSHTLDEVGFMFHSFELLLLLLLWPTRELAGIVKCFRGYAIQSSKLSGEGTLTLHHFNQMHWVFLSNSLHVLRAYNGDSTTFFHMFNDSHKQESIR